MIVNSLKSELQKLLTASLLEVVGSIQDTASDHALYAVAVYCDSGCTSFGVAFNTTEHLELQWSKDTLSRDYYELNAAEWQQVNYQYAVFDSLNSRLDEIYEEFFNADLNDSDIANFFVDVISNSIQSVSLANRFSSRYKGDLLTGLQFADPSPLELQMISAVSKRVNASAWHRKVEKNCHQGVS